MIVVISNPSPIKEEHDIICHLFDIGLEMFHLRKKDLNENQLRAFIEAIPIEYYNRIVLHSHYHLAAEYNLHGIHVPNKYKTLINGSLSVSFHTIKDISEFAQPFNYGFLSPIFDSISKIGYKSNFNLNELKQFLQKQNNKILALGGIDEDKIDAVKELGFSGIALLGAIWQNEQAVEKFKCINKLWLK